MATIHAAIVSANYYNSLSFMYINKETFDPYKPIYRFTTVERLLDILITNELTLVRPKFWNDPFENFLFKQDILTNDGQILNFKYLTETIFGQCWTFKYQSDFAWRVYAPHENGVRIKVTLSELYNYILPQISDGSRIFFGKVQYFPWKSIKEHYENPDFFSKTIFPLDIFSRQDMFIKRKEFKHEEEFRIIFSDDHLKYKNEKTVKFKILPNEQINSILFDPRMSDTDFNNYRVILKQLGYNGVIKKSQLYSLPKLNIKLSNPRV